MLLTQTSWATCPPGHERNDSCGDEADSITASATGSAEATSSSTASAESTSNATSSSGGNSQSINISESHPSSLKIRNVASPDTPNPYPTAPCRVGVSGGLSIPGGALSGGGSVEDEECTLRETARSFKDLGVPEVGLYLLCTQSDVVLGRRNKRGEMEKGEPEPLGATECLRLVREFQGSPDEHDLVGGNVEELRRELAVLQEQLDQSESAHEELAQELAEVREVRSRPAPRPAAARPQIIQQEYLSADKRAKLAALVSDEETEK